MVKARVAVFWNVMFCDGLGNPTVSLEKISALSANKAEVKDATPQPASVTVCFPALSLMVTAAVRAAAAAGLNATLKLQAFPFVSVVPQLLLLMVKSAALLPDVTTLIPVTVDPELFCRLTN